MKLQEILSPSFKDYGVSLPSGKPVILDLWQRCWSTDSQFCKAVVDCGYLTADQMLRAAFRYRLGATRNGGVIFWQIDQEERTHDGKIVYYNPDCHRSKQKRHHPTWVSTHLSRRHHWPDKHQGAHCLFGLHLLTQQAGPLMVPAYLNERATGGAVASPFEGGLEGSAPLLVRFLGASEKMNKICLVEAEKTAFILSELYPEFLWLATGGLSELQPVKFRPLRGHKVILFPDTDPGRTAYTRWFNIAQEVMDAIFWEDSPPIYVSPILELHASPSQKSRKIDLVDFIFESQKSFL